MVSINDGPCRRPCVGLLVCHEHALKYGSVCNCTKDEGRPFGTGLQEQVSNYLKLRW